MKFFWGLNALSHHLSAKLDTKSNDGAHQSKQAAIGGQARDQPAVKLHDLGMQICDVFEVRVPSTQVIDRELHPPVADLLQGFRAKSGVAERHRFGDLNEHRVLMTKNGIIRPKQPAIIEFFGVDVEKQRCARTTIHSEPPEQPAQLTAAVELYRAVKELNWALKTLIRRTHQGFVGKDLRSPKVQQWLKNDTKVPNPNAILNVREQILRKTSSTQTHTLSYNPECTPERSVDASSSFGVRPTAQQTTAEPKVGACGALQTVVVARRRRAFDLGCLDRYLLRHVLRPFLWCTALVVALIFLLQIRKLADAALGTGLTLSDATLIFLSLLPQFLVIVIPLAYMASLMVGLGRLSQDLEILALRAAGADPLRLAKVPLGLGVIIAVAILPIAHLAGPYGLNQLYDRLVQVGIQNIIHAITPGVFTQDLDGLALVIRDRNEHGVLFDVFVFDNRDPAHPVLITADQATLSPTKEGIGLNLTDGEVHLKTQSPHYDRLSFKKAKIGIDVRQELNERTRFLSPIQRMSSREMMQVFQQDSKASLHMRRTERDFWRRFSYPSMALIFGLLATAIMLRGKEQKPVRKVLWALAGVVGYYMLVRVGDYGIAHGLVSPFVCVFGPNLAVLALGSTMLYRAGRPQ